MTTDQTIMNAATKALMNDDDAKELYTQLTATVNMVRKGMPLRLTGRASLMNPLIDLAVADPTTYEAVLDSVDEHRVEYGLAPLGNGKPPVNRNEYIRKTMFARRARSNRVMKAWNSVFPKHEQIVGNARLEFERQHTLRWSAEKNQRVDAEMKRLGRRLSRGELNAIEDKLWEDVDAEIADFEEYARQLLTKPVAQRNIRDYVFTLGRPLTEDQ